MPSKPFPWFKVLLFLALAGAGVFAYLRFSGKRGATPEVTTVTLQRGDVIHSVTATGILQAPVSVDVSSQISGQISAVLVDYNSVVKKGDILAKIDPATYESRLRQTRAQLANAEASHTLARLNAERIRELHTKNLISQQERDQAEAQLTQAEANLRIQQANVTNAEVDLSRCTIYAPIDGLVLDKLCDVGKTVAASFNAPTLFTLVTDLKTLQINADVSEADIGNVLTGQEVTFSVDAYPQQQFKGRVSQIRNVPKTQQSVVVYATIIQVNNDELKLKPGMTANVSIIVAKRTGVVRIPNAALRARIADSYKPAPPAPVVAPTPAATTAPASATAAAPTPAAAAKPADPQARREQMRSLMREVGFSWESGPPSPEMLERIQKLAAERGIELPERFQSRRPANASGPVERVVYKLASPLPNLKLEPVRAKIGITDGTFSEVVEGLAENDVLVSSVFVADEGSSTPASNPFSPGAPGAGGGGNRRF